MSIDLKAEAMGAAFQKRFNQKVVTTWNIFGDRYVTTPIDGDQLTEEQVGWLEGWGDRTVQG
jgi:hypothetical protein